MIFAIDFLRKFEKKIQKKITIHFPTNALLLDEKKFQFFQENKIIVSLSLDTLDTEYHGRDIYG